MSDSNECSANGSGKRWASLCGGGGPEESWNNNKGSSRNTGGGRGIELSGFQLCGTGVVTIRGKKTGQDPLTGGTMLGGGGVPPEGLLSQGIGGSL